MRSYHLIYILALTAIIACQKPDIAETVANTPDEDVELGGKTTIQGSFINIFQQPAPNMSSAEFDLHREADAAFGNKFVTAPSVNNSGLGPIFNQSSCESCHVSNGRSPFPTDPNELRGLLFRISSPGVDVHGEPLAVAGFGTQMQTKAVWGKQPEAHLSISEINEIVAYADGKTIALRKPVYNFIDTYIALPANTQVSPRIASPMIGLGLLEAIDERDITAFADPNDANGDGISGKPNSVWDVTAQAMRLGRFGWKAGQPTLLQQTAAAYSGDMGLTTSFFPTESSFGQLQYDNLNDDAEISDALLYETTFYPQSLGVPARRNYADADVQRGKSLFLSMQCGSCHRPSFVTGSHTKYPFLNQQKIFPYTDLLLHDMGDGLADNRPDFAATGKEWRTPPLWGIGLTRLVGNHTNFLHDGRARSFEEAIMWHGGEAANSRAKFTQLSAADRTAVVRFLESL